MKYHQHRWPDPFWGHSWCIVALDAYPPAAGAEAALWRCWRCHQLRPGYLQARSWCPARYQALDAGTNPATEWLELILADARGGYSRNPSSHTG